MLKVLLKDACNCKVHGSSTPVRDTAPKDKRTLLPMKAVGTLLHGVPCLGMAHPVVLYGCCLSKKRSTVQGLPRPAQLHGPCSALLEGEEAGRGSWDQGYLPDHLPAPALCMAASEGVPCLNYLVPGLSWQHE